MAVDTADKRRSSTYAGAPFYTAAVSIDGSMSQADRQESAWGYSGILASGAIVAPVTLYAKGPKYRLHAKDAKHRLYAKQPKHKLYKV